MGHRTSLVAIVFAAVSFAGACGSSNDGDASKDADASIIGTGGSSSGFSTGSGGTSSNGTGTGNGSGTGGSAASGTGGSSSGMNAGTGGFGSNPFNRDGGTPMMLMCPATQPMDGEMCTGGGGFGGRGMSCMFGDTSCRCRRGMWRCYTPMPPDQDGGM